MEQYLPILGMVLIGIGLPIVAIVFARLLAPNRPGGMTGAPYECGIETTTSVRERLSVRYYLIAVLFVVFDVETIFMFPWAVQYKVLGLFGLVEMVIFIAILLLAYFYVIKKGALKWA